MISTQRIFRHRQGSIMIEAALIMPLLILVVVSLIFICRDMSETTGFHAMTHIYMREAVLEASEGCVKGFDSGKWQSELEERISTVSGSFDSEGTKYSGKSGVSRSMQHRIGGLIISEKGQVYNYDIHHIDEPALLRLETLEL